MLEALAAARARRDRRVARRRRSSRPPGASVARSRGAAQAARRSPTRSSIGWPRACLPSSGRSIRISSPSATSRTSSKCVSSRRTRRVRVPRVVSVVDCGRVMSPRTAASQVRGGVVWGIGAALREASEVDPRFGGFLNADLAEYVVPVNADIGDIEVGLHRRARSAVQHRGREGSRRSVDGRRRSGDRNAVYHATGRRVRDLPIRIEHLID